MVNILIIEDEADLLATLEYNLQRAGYRTHGFLTGEDGLEWALQHEPPGLALLDVMLPGISGVEVCYRLRAHETTRKMPIVFLSAKGADIDRVIGFELGADDYVVKPFNVRELLLRIRAILRRSGEESAAMGEMELTIGPLRIDSKRHQLWVGGEEVVLTPLEFRMLSLLLTRRGRVQSREALLADIWEANTSVQLRTVDVHINRLREKLGAAGDMLETIRGIGYRFQGHN
ncbi:MAG: response regulator transcription factor [Magnetococcales bacterium]|nr:response regulator transcription factor [Magnetococcales bacterium]